MADRLARRWWEILTDPDLLGGRPPSSSIPIRFPVRMWSSTGSAASYEKNFKFPAWIFREFYGRPAAAVVTCVFFLFLMTSGGWLVFTISRKIPKQRPYCVMWFFVHFRIWVTLSLMSRTKGRRLIPFCCCPSPHWWPHTMRGLSVGDQRVGPDEPHKVHFAKCSKSVICSTGYYQCTRF